jgi:hypothetical protein
VLRLKNIILSWATLTNYIAIRQYRRVVKRRWMSFLMKNTDFAQRTNSNNNFTSGACSQISSAS